MIAALHHHNIKTHLERISNIRPYIANYNWKDFTARKTTGKNLKEIIKIWLLISYTHHPIKNNKYRIHIEI